MNDIPSDFYSDYSGSLFESCIDCGEPLLIGHKPYLVMKHIVARETVFEMAMCLPCAASLQQEYSEESKLAIELWMADRFPPRGQPLDSSSIECGEAEDDSVDPGAGTQDPDASCGIEQCQFCQTPRSKAHRYSIAALCTGQSLISTTFLTQLIAFPYLVCEECNAEVSELISQQTRDRWNRFVEDHFDGPPGIEVDPVDSDLMFV